MPDIPDVLSGLSRSYLFEDLDREDLAPLAAAVATRRLVSGEYLWRAGDAADEICVMLTGEVKDTVVDVDGNEVVHFVHGPGMTFGEPGYFAVDHRRIVDVVAVVPTAVIVMRRRELAPFIAAHPSVKDRALEGLASTTRWQSNMIVSLFQRPLADRVALRLLELAGSSSARVEGLPATPPISQATLAGMIGVTRENVNRALASLVAGGFVRYHQHRYLITDEAGLRERVSAGWPLAERRDRRYD